MSSSASTNATNSILDGTNIDLSVISYSAPKPHASGGKVCNIYNKNAREAITISVPMMGAWSAKETTTNEGEPTGKYTMSLQFSKGEYTTPEADAFLENMKALENKIKNDAMLYSKEWFGKEIKNMEVIDEKFYPMLRYPKKKGTEERDYDASPSLTLKLPCWKGVWQTSVFDEDYNPLYVKNNIKPDVSPLNFLTSASKAPIQVICLIQSAGLWFTAGKVSVTWNLKQVIVKKPREPSIKDDTCFLMVRPSELEALKKLPEPEPEQLFETVSTNVHDSDDETSAPPPSKVPVSEPEPISEPAPVQTEEVPPAVVPSATTEQAEPPKKKTVVRKKKDT